MDFSWLKEWAPTIMTLVLPGVGLLIRYAWKISKDLDEMKQVYPKIVSHEERLDVHDKLATSVFGKPIDSKLISEGRQTYPLFHIRKSREDH